MAIDQVLQSDTVMTLLGGVLGLVWTAFRSSEWMRNIRNQRFAKAMTALEAGVEQTYRTYVQALKTAKEDGKLSPEEAREARRRARDAAIAFGRTQGVDVLAELGADFIELRIAKLVKSLKNRTAGGQ